MDANVYSQRLGPISVAQLQAALDRFGLGAFVRAAPTFGGLFGQNLSLTSDQGEFVLRGKPHYPWQLPTEQFFARLQHERTVAPTPGIQTVQSAFIQTLPDGSRQLRLTTDDHVAVEVEFATLPK